MVSLNWTVCGIYIQLFRERLSDKVHATNPKRYCGWSWVHCFSKTFERMAGEAMDICLRVLKESNKCRFNSYSVRNSVLIISHITFWDCKVHIFSDNLSQNSCIWTGWIIKQDCTYLVRWIRSKIEESSWKCPCSTILSASSITRYLSCSSLLTCSSPCETGDIRKANYIHNSRISS